MVWFLQLAALTVLVGPPMVQQSNWAQLKMQKGCRLFPFVNNPQYIEVCCDIFFISISPLSSGLVEQQLMFVVASVLVGFLVCQAESVRFSNQAIKTQHHVALHRSLNNLKKES